MLILRTNMHLLFLSFLLPIQNLQISANIFYSINSTQSLLSQHKIISPENHLIETIYNNSKNYNCDFNHLQFCSFEHSLDWSFQLSLSEFAFKMKEAAELAAKNVQNFHVKLSQNNGNNNTMGNQNKILSNSQYSQLPSVLIPTVNYFPCSTNQTEHSYMKLNIQWPTYYVTHRPIAPEDVTISARESTSSNNQSRLSSFTSSTTRQKRSIYYQVKQSNKNLISRQLYTFSKSIPIACLQLKIRFLPGSSMLGSKVVLRLGANKQIIRNVFNIDKSFNYEDIYYYDNNSGNIENDMTLTSSYPFTQSKMISKLDWSILRQYISDLENNTLPYNVWINVTMPIYATTSTTTTTTINPNVVYNQNTNIDSFNQGNNHSVNDKNVMKLTQFTDHFIKQSDNWFAIDSMQTLFLYSTNNVCIDDISLLCNINQQFTLSTCQRQLSWINTHKQGNQSNINNLNLNIFGYPIVNSTYSLNPNEHLIVQSFKSFNSSRYSLYYNSFQLIWLAGSLILAIFITFLTILFIITLSLSIMCDQRKTHHLSTEYNISSRNEKYQNNNNNNFLINKQRNHRKFCLNHHYNNHCNNELLKFSSDDLNNNSLLNKLHNHLSSSSLLLLSSFHGVLYPQQLNEQQLINQKVGTKRQQFIDDNSTELSLCIQDDKNELVHSINKQNVINSSDTSVTSALQLLRNWNFYKQRNNPSCCYYSPPGSSFVNHSTCCLSPNNVMMKYPGIKRNASKTSTSLYVDHHNHPLLGRGRIDSHGNPMTANNAVANLHDTLEENVMYRCQSPHLNNLSEVRQSLILSVNDDNELVILPSSTVGTSIDIKENERDHMLCSNNNHNNDNHICSMLNSLSEEDAETTRLEMAASVNALDQYLHNDNTLDGIVDPSDYTLSTIPRSLIMNNEPPPPTYSDSSV